MAIKKSMIITVAVIAILSLFSCQNNSFKMASTSMEPTIKKGEVVTANLSIYKKELPSRGDIVIFHSPVLKDKNWAMRVVGLPGEVVSFDSLGILINYKPLESNFSNVKYTMADSGIGSSKFLVHPYQIPDNQYYLLGDNIKDSYDSRFWGSISKDQIFGKVIRD